MQKTLTHSFIKNRKIKPVVLTIAGSDSAGMAGIQMDLRCFNAFDVHGATVITVATAQNSDAFFSLNTVKAQALKDQLKAALQLKPQAIKIGMIATVEQVIIISSIIKEYIDSNSIPIVYDPIVRTSSNKDILNSELIEKIIYHLCPLCTVITPNLPEAEALSQQEINKQNDITTVAQKLHSLGPSWVIIKGGHSQNNLACDFISESKKSFSLTHKKIPNKNTRGTGCAFSSFLASSLALGYDVRDACVITKMAMYSAIKDAKSIDSQKACVNPSGFPRSHWPKFQDEHTQRFDQLSFPNCVGDTEPKDLGLYPIVDSVSWLRRLLPHGMTTVQLRNKTLSGKSLELEIEEAIELCKQYRCRLFINDHWQIAIKKGAYGVHLGQEDLQSADFTQIAQANLRLGLSNHSHFELTRALKIKPSYIACGPIFATTTKNMPWIPHGLDGLRYWKKSLPEIPLVAIGGINEHNINDISATGVSGISVISAITQDNHPEEKLRELIKLVKNNRPKN